MAGINNDVHASGSQGGDVARCLSRYACQTGLRRIEHVNKDISISPEFKLDHCDEIGINFMLMSRFAPLIADGDRAHFDAVTREAFKRRTGLDGATECSEVRIMASCGRAWNSTTRLVRRYKYIGQGALGKASKHTQSEKLRIRPGSGENDFRISTAKVASDAVANVSEPFIEGNRGGRFNVNEAFQLDGRRQETLSRNIGRRCRRE